MIDRREFVRHRALIEQDKAEPAKRDIHKGDHCVIITAILVIAFVVGYVCAEGNAAVIQTAAAHADITRR